MKSGDLYLTFQDVELEKGFFLPTEGGSDS